MVGIGFCSDCGIRIFGDEKEGLDYINNEGVLTCMSCILEEE